MDETDLVSYYTNKAKEWIFIPKLQNILIEDDEILDLDSINLDSNEDTWLYSSSNKSFADRMSDSSEKILDNKKLNKKSDFLQEIESSNEKCIYMNNNTSIFSPDSPLLCVDDFQHNSFLNSFDTISDSAVDDLLRTPAHLKSKSNFLKKVLSTPQYRINSEDTNTFIKPKTELYIPNDLNTNTFKKPFNDSVEKSYILHSVENKLFDGNDFKNVQNKEIKIIDDDRKNINEIEIKDYDKTTRLTPTRCLSQKLNQIQTDMFRQSDIKAFENDENTFKKEFPLSHSTPFYNENTNKPMSMKKVLPLCQPSPVLLNRYLKYNKIEEKDTDNSLRQRASNENMKYEINDVCDKPYKNEMNVSYTKYMCNDDTDLPNVNQENSLVKSNLNNTYSKSEDVLSSSSNAVVEEVINSVYDLCIEEDVKSSTSESSLSSISNKHSLSIKEVEKMAKLQELSLKEHIHSSYYAGSSKSSEVSSSNESISAFGPLSSSNESQITVNTLRNISSDKILRNQNMMHSKGMSNPIQTLNSKSVIMYGHRQSTLSTNNNIQQAHVLNSNTIKLSNMFKNKALTNGGSNVKQISNKNESNVRNTLTSKYSVDHVANVKAEFVSIKEIKSKDNTEVKASVKSSVNVGPASHIPRPSSKIPMLRTSTSCNRYSQSK